MNALLLTTLLIPLAAAALLLAARSSLSYQSARKLALVVSVATLMSSLALGYQFVRLPAADMRSSPVEPRYSIAYPWFSNANDATDLPTERALRFEFLLGLDGISLALVVLTTVLTVPCVLISWESIRERATGFYACLLLLEAGLIGVFCAFDLVLFYVFFEFTLVPLFFLIGVWGGPQRRYAAVKFFLYTLVGSLITLV
jgi:NADH-quinone oxidoreductase subunit M